MHNARRFTQDEIQDARDLLAESLANSYAKTTHTPKPSKHGRARTLVYVAGPFSGKGATRAEQRADTEQKIERAADKAKD